MSDNGSLPPGDRILPIKSSINGIAWQEQYRERLQIFVNIIHTTTMHTYCLSKYIFLREFHQNPNFPIGQYLNRGFFAEVWLSLVNYNRGSIRAATTINYRGMIIRHLPDYLATTGYQLPVLEYAQQSSLIEGNKIYDSYMNNVKTRFGQHLRRAINRLLNIPQRTADLRQQLSDEGIDDNEISRRVREEIRLPARRFKLAIATRTMNLDQLPQVSPLYTNALNAIQPVLNAYPRGYHFGRLGIYYDAKSNPGNHFVAFYQIARLFETLDLPLFNCFPLRRSFIPGYAQIDSKILCQNILGRKWSNAVNKLDYWRQVVDLDSEAFRPQEDGRLCFRGTIQTDGVGVSIFKKRNDRQGRYSSRVRVEVERTRYISELTAAEHQEIVNDCVAVDPGRRDQLFCVHEDSTVAVPQKFRYTKANQDKTTKTKKYRNILQDLKRQHPDVAAAENMLGEHPGTGLTVENFEIFLSIMWQQSPTLNQFYASTRTNAEPHNFLFRKLRLNSYFNRERADLRLVSSITEKFGPHAVLLMGNWSAPHTAYQEPIRGVGFRNLLKKHNFRVFLVDEFKTSKCCPTCHQESLRTFKRVVNPRPYHRARTPRVLCHGLLRCTNQTCTETMQEQGYVHRLWNRDLAACLNFTSILRSLRNNGTIPERFRRTAPILGRRRRGGGEVE